MSFTRARFGPPFGQSSVHNLHLEQVRDGPDSDLRKLPAPVTDADRQPPACTQITVLLEVGEYSLESVSSLEDSLTVRVSEGAPQCRRPPRS